MVDVSIVVPVYNVAPYLPRCIDSILGQTYSNFNLILVDDGSTDDGGVICDEYAARDTRIKVIHRPNGGLSAARNTGIDWVVAHHPTEYLAFIDSDDWVHPEYLQHLRSSVEKSGCAVSACWCQTVKDGTVPKEVSAVDFEVLKPEVFWVRNRIAAVVAWGKLYRTRLFEGIRYPEGKIHEDEYVTPQVLFSQNEVAVTFAQLYYYFQRSDSIIGARWSGKHLDAIDGLEWQLSYFNQHGMDDALRASLVSYKKHLAAGLWALSSLHDEESCRLRDKLLFMLQDVHARYADRFPPDYLGDRDVYVWLFPIRARFCYLAYRLADVIRRRGWLWIIKKVFGRA